MHESTEAARDNTFLAPPGAVRDWRLMVLFDAASQAGLLDDLPATAAQLADRRGLDPHWVGVVLDALGAFGVASGGGDGRYSRGPACPGPEEAAVLAHHSRVLHQWARNLGGRAPGETPTTEPAEPLTMSPDAFLGALAVGARRSAPPVIDACLARFPQARSVLDLGGGHGEYALEVARRGLRAVMQDRPPMVEVVERQGRVAEGGVELFAGDFFEVLPEETFDLVLVVGVTHTFDSQANRTLYSRLRSVVAPGGGVAIVTFLRRRNPVASIFAVQMLVNGHGGDTHGEDDYRRWFEEAGFLPDDPVDLAGMPQSLLCATSPAPG